MQAPLSNLAPRPSMWRALSHRNYRLFFAGQGISVVGTWMTRVATSWFVFRIGGDNPEFLLGAVGFAGQIPAFFLAPFAGVLVDRWSRHRLLVVTQVLSLVQSALLAAVAFASQSASTAILEVFLLSVFQGFINAFDMPVRQSFLVEMVGNKEDLPNAIALNSSLVNGARLVGPSVAGILIYLVGESWCFVTDAVSYVAVIAALLAMRLPVPRQAPRHPNVWHGVAEGFRYAFGFAPIRSILLLLALVSFMGMPYTVLMPIFAAQVLHAGPSAPYVLGALSTAAGVGALFGALLLASRRTVLGLGRAITLATLLFGGGLIGFSMSRSLWLSLLMLLMVGFGMMVAMASSNTILQTITEENKRGRVMSFYTMAFMGMAPFGSLFAGALASLVDAPFTVAVGGIACLGGAGLFAWQLPRLRVLVRPIYMRLGILPEIAAGVESASELTMAQRD